MMPTIRRAIESDLDGLLVLYRALRPTDPALPPARANELLAQLLAREDVDIMVCDLDCQLVATCMLAMIPNLASGGQPIGVIEHVITLASHRGQGLAKLLLTQTLARAWQLNCCKVMLLSGAQREDAHKLYAAVGFDGDTERGFVIKRPR